KDMNFEEILGIFGPVLYLVPLVIAVLFIALIITLLKSLAPKFLAVYMNIKGISVEKKRAFLTKFLTHTSFLDYIRGRKICPVCGKNYATKIKSKNERGDVTVSYVDNGCPCCKTSVSTTPEENNKKYYCVTRSITTSVKEPSYKRSFDRLTSYVDFYKPYVDTSYSSSDNDGDGSVRVDVYFH
ncbi:MAG: hypothetical protein J6Q58_03935, partial [Clostridia bacterium]|nr:hypothetical protein [Clostridia bacterium]